MTWRVDLGKAVHGLPGQGMTVRGDQPPDEAIIVACRQRGLCPFGNFARGGDSRIGPADRPNPDWGGFGVPVAAGHRIGKAGARYPHWRRNGQIGDFHGRSTRMVNRAYPERHPALSAPDRNKNPGLRRLTGMDYRTSIIKVLSQNDQKRSLKSNVWRSSLT